MRDWGIGDVWCVTVLIGHEPCDSDCNVALRLLILLLLSFFFIPPQAMTTMSRIRRQKKSRKKYVNLCRVITCASVGLKLNNVNY